MRAIATTVLRGGTRGPGRANDLDQVRGVGAPFEPQSEHLVIGRVLALSTECPFRRPEQRMKPEDCAGDLRRHMNEPIGTSNMRELVREHGAQPLLLPLMRSTPAEAPEQRRMPHVIGINAYRDSAATQRTRLRPRASAVSRKRRRERGIGDRA